MTEYYVSGCIDNGSEVETCDDSEATFWTLYERGDDGLSQGIIDCTFREDAEAAMRVYQERDALQQQGKELDKESQNLSNQLGACGRDLRAMRARAHVAEAELERMKSQSDSIMQFHRVKLKTRKQMQNTIPREELGWWHDVCPGELMILRDATEEDLARCHLRPGSSIRASDYLCEMGMDGALVNRKAIASIFSFDVPVLIRSSLINAGAEVKS